MFFIVPQLLEVMWFELTERVLTADADGSNAVDVSKAGELRNEVEYEI